MKEWESDIKKQQIFTQDSLEALSKQFIAIKQKKRRIKFSSFFALKARRQKKICVSERDRDKKRDR